MKTNKSYLIINILIFLLIGSLSYIFIINKGIDYLHKSDSIKTLSDEDIEREIESINTKYIEDLKSIDEEYLPKFETIEDTYKAKYEELDKKYNKDLKEYNSKYNKIEKDIKAKYEKKINALDSKYDVPMLNDNWYDLQVKKMKEQSKLREAMYDEIEEKTSSKSSDYSRIVSNKNKDERLIDSEKKNEIDNLNKQIENKKSSLEELKEIDINNIKNTNSDKGSYTFKGLLLIILGLVIILLYPLYVVSSFNRLVKRENSVKEALSNIEVLLKRRFDLIPNFVETVEGYTKHEKSTLKEVIELRNGFNKAKNLDEEMKLNKDLSNNIQKIFAVVEKYPDLKADKNFIKLQDELLSTENGIAHARANYNRMVLKYQNYYESFPTILISKMFGFDNVEFFEIKSNEKENVKVKI